MSNFDSSLSGQVVTFDVEGVSVDITVNFLANNNGEPGESLTDNIVSEGEEFFVEILVATETTVGVSTLSLDVDFEETVIEALSDFESPETVITEKFDFEQSLTAELSNGSLTLGGGTTDATTDSNDDGVPDNVIGANGNPERFALLEFNALEATESSTLGLEFPGNDENGNALGGTFGDGTPLNDEIINFSSPSFQVGGDTPTPPEAIDITVNFLANNNGEPGESLTDNIVSEGEEFFVEILVATETTVGVSTLSLDVDFEETVIEALSDFESPETVITEKFDFEQSLTAELSNGSLTLGGGTTDATTDSNDDGVPDNVIGANGNPERFALLEFNALEATESSTLGLEFPGIDENGNALGGTFGDGTSLNDEIINFSSPSFQVAGDDTPTPDISARSSSQSSINFNEITRDLLPNSVQGELDTIAQNLETDVNTLLQNIQIAEISASPSGEQVLNDLQEAGGITGTISDLEISNVVSSVF